MAPCPICRHPAALRSHNKAFPFCSARCKQVDLGGWLDERYRLPASDADAAELASALERYSEEKA